MTPDMLEWLQKYILVTAMAVALALLAIYVMYNNRR